jgi:LytS/YehU family sensor histidine kinase
MLKDVTAANKMISRLGELLRLTLEKNDQQEVSLQQEIEFLRRCLEIEQIRFGERLQLKMEVDPSTLATAVPNLILQPLVENAVRHAIELHRGRRAGAKRLECVQLAAAVTRSESGSKRAALQTRARHGTPLSGSRSRCAILKS